MKYEYKKEEKELYCPKEKPQLLTVPKHKFFCIKGKGNPNNEDFAKRVGVLFSLSYVVRMMPKNGFTPTGYYEYTVYPLEGLWDLSDEGKMNEVLTKDELCYTIMIRQPDFVDKDVIIKAFEIANKKKPDPLLREVYFDEITDGLSVQMLHVGSYDDEPKSFNEMKEYIFNNGYRIKTLVHREIYLSDVRKVDRSKLKTILRYSVEKLT